MLMSRQNDDLCTFTFCFASEGIILEEKELCLEEEAICK